MANFLTLDFFIFKESIDLMMMSHVAINHSQKTLGGKKGEVSKS